VASNIRIAIEKGIEACGTHLDPGRLAVHIQHVGSSPHTMLSALADNIKHFAPLRLSRPKLCMHIVGIVISKLNY
jgi:hypothetical protein